MKNNRLILLGMLFVVFSLLSCNDDDSVISVAGGGGGSSSNNNEVNIELTEGKYTLNKMTIDFNSVESNFEEFYNDLPENELKNKLDLRNEYIRSSTLIIDGNSITLRVPELSDGKYELIESYYTEESLRYGLREIYLIVYYIPRSGVERPLTYNLYFTKIKDGLEVADELDTDNG